MTTYHDDVELEDFKYDQEDNLLTYNCPCGDFFEITPEELLEQYEIDPEDIKAVCPSCSLYAKIICDGSFLEVLEKLTSKSYKSKKTLKVTN